MDGVDAAGWSPRDPRARAARYYDANPVFPPVFRNDIPFYRKRIPFVCLIEAHGFAVAGRWGGYAGGPSGKGPERVVQFAVSNRKDICRD